MVKNPIFIVVSVCSLALGIGAATSVFGLVNAAVLRRDPHVANPETLVRIFGTFPPDEFYGPLAYRDVADIGEHASSLSEIAAYRSTSLTLSLRGGGSRQIQAEQVSPNWFSVLRVPIPLGRGFLPEDETPIRPPESSGHR